MEQNNAVNTLPEVVTPKSHVNSPDLSAEIVRAVQKQPGDRVKCRRVSAQTYRCNWFAVDRSAADQNLMFMDTYRIRDSRFLRVRKIDGQLVIEDLTVEAVRNN